MDGTWRIEDGQRCFVPVATPDQVREALVEADRFMWRAMPPGTTYLEAMAVRNYWRAKLAAHDSERNRR